MNIITLYIDMGFLRGFLIPKVESSSSSKVTCFHHTIIYF